MIATQHHGKMTIAQSLSDRIKHGLVPVDGFFQMTQAVDRLLPGIGRTVQIATVNHLQLTCLQRFRQSGNAQCVWSHACAFDAGTNIGWCSN